VGQSALTRLLPHSLGARGNKMRNISTLLIILVLVTLHGCSESSEQQGYNSTQELVTAYQSFHATRNIDGLLSLVYSQSDDKEIHLTSFNEDVKLTITNIVVERLKSGDLDAWEKRGIRPSITPVAWLKVTFQIPGQNEPGTSYSQYLIGEEKGRYYIATNK